MRGKWPTVAGVAAATVTVVVAVMVLSTARAQARAEEVTAAHLGEALAVVQVIDVEVDHRGAIGSAWSPATDGQALDEGHGVRTDATGFAEVLYADGSLTRMDVLTEFQIVSLSQTSVAPEIEVRLEVGRVWNRVQDVTGQRGSFEVQTPVGTAAVRGTVFVVECDRRPVCTFTVIEGLVEVTTLDGQVFLVRAGEELTLGIDGRDDPVGFGGGGGGESGGPFGGGGADAGTGGTSGAGTGSAADPAVPGFVGTLGAGESVVPFAQETPGVGVIAEQDFVAHNLGLDAASGRDEDGSADCAVSVGGRNVELAGTPATAIDVPVDEEVSFSAVSTGELDRYRVDVYLADLSFLAAEGEVAPDDLGDRTTFRGSADVSDYARWGAGLYEVRARTTGTACDVRAFINVTGGSPLLTLPSVVGLLLLAGGLTGLVAAAGGLWSGGSGSPTIGPVTPSSSMIDMDTTTFTKGPGTSTGSGLA